MNADARMDELAAEGIPPIDCFFLLVVLGAVDEFAARLALSTDIDARVLARELVDMFTS